MTIKEINAMRDKQRKLLQDKNESHNEFHAMNNRIMEDLDLQEKLAHDDLVKRIKKHFKGITPSIDITNWHILISFNDVEFLDYRYGHTKFEGITKKLCNTIISEYEAVYGEIVENANASYKLPMFASGMVTGISINDNMGPFGNY